MRGVGCSGDLENWIEATTTKANQIESDVAKAQLLKGCDQRASRRFGGELRDVLGSHFDAGDFVGMQPYPELY